MRREIARKAYERREIANTRVEESAALPFNVFKDPYLLDVLGLKDNFEVLCCNLLKPTPPSTFSINRKKLLPYLKRLPDHSELERLFLEFLETRFGHQSSA